jgi:dienelactone hydrolase
MTETINKRLADTMKAHGHRVSVRLIEGELHCFMDKAEAINLLPDSFENLPVVPRIQTTGGKVKVKS